MKKDILGVRFDDVSRQEAAQLGAAMLEQDQFHYVVTPNPEFILAAEKDADFRQVLNSADLVIPDGIGVVYSAKILGTPLKERVPGIEFAADMLAQLDQMGGRLYLLGAGTQVLVWPLAWGVPWMSLPATWSGRPNLGGSWVWSGPTA